MPLPKFFPKRNSLKNKAEAQLTKKEISELQSKARGSVDATNVPQHENVTTEVENVVDCHKTDSDESSVRLDTRKSSASSEDSQHAESKSVPKPVRTKNRSTSFKESRSGSCKESHSVSSKESRSTSCKESRAVSFKGCSRRKSEGVVQNSSTDDEGFSDRTIQLKEKDLEKVIGQYVDKLIRESIVSAVRSVDIDNLCEEVIKDVSSRSQSESSEGTPGTVEQKLHTKSVTEYVQLEDEEASVECGTKDYSAREESSCEGDSKRSDSMEGSSNLPGDGQTKGEMKGFSSDGYQADVEESESCLPTESSSDEMKVKENRVTEETSSDDSKTVEHTERTVSFDETSGKDDPKEVLETSEVCKEEDDSVPSQEYADLKVPEKDVEDSSLLKATTDEDSDSSSAVKTDSEEKGRMSSESKESEDDSDSHSADERKRKSTLKAPEQPDLILMSLEDEGESQPRNKSSSLMDEPSTPVSDLIENLPQKDPGADDEKKVNWKMGYLHVKLPHKARGKGNLKVWKKRCVAFQADEFSSEPSLMMSVYSAESSKHSANFWRSVSGAKAVVYRSSSRSHRYAFTVAEDGKPQLHLAADCEATAQEWMAAARAVLWPPSPVVQLEKMLNGSEFEVSLIDNEFSYRAGLLGMYGYMSITPKKLILVHPHLGYVIQEWYLNTVDRFQLVQQSKIQDVHKVLAMTTCSDSSTGKGEILIYCTEALALLQSLAATIHQILTYHSSQEGGIYQKELEAMAEWLVVSNPPEDDSKKAPAEEHYKVPRQVKSLLDIPNFIFDKPLACGASSGSEASLDTTPKADPPSSSDDFLNCSVTSFRLGGGQGVGKSSDSELSDSYTPPQSPATKTKEAVAKRTDQK